MDLEEIKITEWKYKVFKLWTQIYVNASWKNKIPFPYLEQFRNGHVAQF